MQGKLPHVLANHPWEENRRGARLGGRVTSRIAMDRLTIDAPLSFCPLKMKLPLRPVTIFPTTLMILELIWIVLGHQDEAAWSRARKFEGKSLSSSQATIGSWLFLFAFGINLATVQ